MLIMPANSTGWWHALARETGNIGHLYSPGAERGPFPWMPYALDNGCFSMWDQRTNWFKEDLWLSHGLPEWLRLLTWAQTNNQSPIWAIVADRPGSWAETCDKWERYATLPELKGIRLAVAVQDGATALSVRSLRPVPSVVCVGGSTTKDGKGGWKWETAEMWGREFRGAHLLRCNRPCMLPLLEEWGYASCDGTGWNRGDRTQTQGVEEFCRRGANPYQGPIWPYVSRGKRVKGSTQMVLL